MLCGSVVVLCADAFGPSLVTLICWSGSFPLQQQPLPAHNPLHAALVFTVHAHTHIHMHTPTCTCTHATPSRPLEFGVVILACLSRPRYGVGLMCAYYPTHVSTNQPSHRCASVRRPSSCLRPKLRRGAQQSRLPTRPTRSSCWTHRTGHAGLTPCCGRCAPWLVACCMQ